MPQKKNNSAGEQYPTRRTILKGGLAVSATAAIGISTSGIGFAQSAENLELEVNAEAETVIIHNTGDSSVDLTGYQMNFEAGEDSEVDQIRMLAGEVIIEAGGSIIVATGAGEEGDVSLDDPYDGEVLNNDGSDVVALLTPDGDIVVTSEGGSGGSDTDNDDDETHTLTVTIIDSRDGSVVSGEVTVDGETKTTTPENEEDSEAIIAEFELEDGTYSVSATYEQPDETLESDEQEVEIDGEDESVALAVYPPDSDEDEEDDEGEENDEEEAGEEDGDSADTDTGAEEEKQEDDCPEEEPEPEPEKDDCPEEEPEPKPEEDCPDN